MYGQATMKGNIKELYELIGENIKENRKYNSMGQKDLANRISLSRSSISNVEIGIHQPSIYTIYEIALALNCEIKDLLPSIENYKSSRNLLEDKYSDIFKSLPNDISKNNLSILKQILESDDK